MNFGAQCARQSDRWLTATLRIGSMRAPVNATHAHTGSVRSPRRLSDDRPAGRTPARQSPRSTTILPESRDASGKAPNRCRAGPLREWMSRPCPEEPHPPSLAPALLAPRAVDSLADPGWCRGPGPSQQQSRFEATPGATARRGDEERDPYEEQRQSLWQLSNSGRPRPATSFAAITGRPVLSYGKFGKSRLSLMERFESKLASMRYTPTSGAGFPALVSRPPSPTPLPGSSAPPAEIPGVPNVGPILCRIDRRLPGACWRAVKVPAARKFERVSTRRPGLARTPPARPRKLRETSRQYPEASR